MSDCRSIDPHVTAYIDGEIGAAERQAVDQHLRACPPCHSRVAAERAVRELCRQRKDALHATPAPDPLRARCSELAGLAGVGQVFRPAGAKSPWRARVMPFAAAAALVLVAAGVFVYQLTSRSSRVMAAELTADHVKCFAINTVLGTHQTSEVVERSMASNFDWPMQLPGPLDRAGLELVGARPCLYGEGRVAHIMYRYNGRPVSLFMLPNTARDDELVEVFGHQAAVWSAGDRTFVLIGRETRSDVERLVAFVRTSLR